MNIEVGQLWKDEDGVMFEVVNVQKFVIDGLGACDLESIDGKTSINLGFGTLTRNYTFVCNKVEVVRDKGNMQKEHTSMVGKSNFKFRTSMPEIKEFNHYYINVSSYDYIDIYRVTDLYGATSAEHHAVKKILCGGKRGAKDKIRDLKEAMASIERQIEMLEEDSCE